MNKLAVIVAGGTGGHINAAIALGEVARAKNYQVQYISGTRHLDYKLFQGKNCMHLNSSALRYKNPFKILKSIASNFYYFFKIFYFFLINKPAFVIGCGGYVCGPVLMAAYLQGIKVYIVEQNAVMGLTNKILGYFSKKIFVHFKKTNGVSKSQLKKVVVSGNPTRSVIYKSDKTKNTKFNILVFGGSLGAKQINDTIKELVGLSLGFPVKIQHQTGLDQREELKLANDIEYYSYEYLDNIQNFYNEADLIICRAGASTVSELRVLERACVFIPYPQATDNHQYYNAIYFKEEASFPVYILDQKASAQENVKKLREIITDCHKHGIKFDNRNLNAKSESANFIIEQIFQDLAL
ncbi:MAG: UDP-N-acetylglucosamine--N-acetylmuramyl-(pentapeptide) pyrophosphoryl-undecaprenol N-acetylglucosamine transferase [Bacteriovoracaceae bacterium]|nr:UDP-N-acetylglucosamine--N-acetylmuramyl-(pentapeptide) pyrophosphoryl-undecaprenol N-acetylglucosamine transferase [Bacteriovoracaceae bacterium]